MAKTIPISLLFALSLCLSGVTAGEIFVPLGQRTVGFEIVEHRGQGPLLLVLHSNEKTGVAVGREMIGRHPGRLAIIQAGGARRLSLLSESNRVTVDPNRVFSLSGVTRDLNNFSIFREQEAKACHQFGQNMVKALGIKRGASPVVALHNNANGGYSIISYEQGGREAAAAERIHRSPNHDTDNFFLVTSRKLYEVLAARGYNVVLQSKQAPDDGSLSVYCGKAGILYINVESQHGDADSQRKMLSDLFEILEGRGSASATTRPETKKKKKLGNLFKKQKR